MSFGSALRVHAVAEPGLGNTSYVVDAGDGLALAVDPPRDVEAALALADRHGLRIVAALETHLHADFVSGARELADAVGADVVTPREARTAFPHRGVAEGDALPVGRVAVRVLSTPGHTPEHVSYLVEEDGRPSAVFTGGSLIGGGAARTDLIAPERTDELARAQFRSLRRLAALPDDTAVHPTHGAGSFCSAGPSVAGAATVGDHRRTNPLLSAGDEDVFVRMLCAGYGSYPPYFLRLREVNRAGPTLRRALPDARALAPHEAAEAVQRGAWLVDARPASEWAAGHPEGAVSIALRPAFASWLGWVVPFGAPVVLVVAGGDLDEVVRQALGIGYDAVLGWVAGGVDGWRDAGLPVARAEELDARGAAERVTRGTPLLDVRQDAEHALARIPGSIHVELGDMIAGRLPDVPEVVTFCGHGERSATAASILERAGIRAASLAGGIGAWREAGLPVEP